VEAVAVGEANELNEMKFSSLFSFPQLTVGLGGSLSRSHMQWS
jgi:hypothetical protein